jgi:hypothetical protein
VYVEVLAVLARGHVTRTLHCRGRLVTLRLRSLPGREIPELFDGDRIVAKYKNAKKTGKKSKKASKEADEDAEESSQEEHGDEASVDSEDSDLYSEGEDQDDGSSKSKRKRKKLAYHTKIFKVLSIHWGLMPYINLLVEGAASRGGGSSNRSSSNKCCFAICEMIA